MSRTIFPKTKPNKNITSARCPKCVKGLCEACTGVNCKCVKCGGEKPRRVC